MLERSVVDSLLCGWKSALAVAGDYGGRQVYVGMWRVPFFVTPWYLEKRLREGRSTRARIRRQPCGEKSDGCKPQLCKMLVRMALFLALMGVPLTGDVWQRSGYSKPV